MYETLCTSTNSLAAKCLKKLKLTEGTVILTDNQSEGRGQWGNTWISAPDQNLTFSVILYPDFLEASKSFELNIMASLAIQYVLKQYISKDLTIKWPNDVYYQDKKLGGILIENIIAKDTIKATIMGIGLNVNQKKFPLQNVTSLAIIYKCFFHLPTLFTKLLNVLEQYYLQLRERDVVPLQEAYLKNMYWLNTCHTFEDLTHRFQGTIRGIDAVGRLIIEHLDCSFKHYACKAITFIK